MQRQNWPSFDLKLLDMHAGTLWSHVDLISRDLAYDYRGRQRSICYHRVLGSGKCKWSDVMGIMGYAKVNEPNFEVHGLTGTQRGCGDVWTVFRKMGNATRKSGQF